MRPGFLFIILAIIFESVSAQKIDPYKPDFSAAPRLPGLTLAWSDEFNTSGRPDSTKWTYENGFVRNQELQWYQKENAIVKGGCLLIEGRSNYVSRHEVLLILSETMPHAYRRVYTIAQ